MNVEKTLSRDVFNKGKRGRAEETWASFVRKLEKNASDVEVETLTPPVLRIFWAGRDLAKEALAGAEKKKEQKKCATAQSRRWIVWGRNRGKSGGQKLIVEVKEDRGISGGGGRDARAKKEKKKGNKNQMFADFVDWKMLEEGRTT